VSPTNPRWPGRAGVDPFRTTSPAIEVVVVVNLFNECDRAAHAGCILERRDKYASSKFYVNLPSQFPETPNHKSPNSTFTTSFSVPLGAVLTFRQEQTNVTRKSQSS
jgi:hypothetical protein